MLSSIDRYPIASNHNVYFLQIYAVRLLNRFQMQRSLLIVHNSVDFFI